MKSSRSIRKRGLAVCMMLVMAFMLSATPLHESNVQAATVKSASEYIKEVKLFIKKGGTDKDAEAWCQSQGDGWKVLVKGSEAGDLNAGASGAFSSEVGVFLCYKTTTDPEEAITDLAVMNEKGNYSEGEYENLLKKQKETYMDMVKNMETMIGEYRKNYENKIPVAVKAHDFLNIFKDDDSGELLGDILLNADDDRLAGILLQCNGMVVLTMQEKLAAACDTGKATWLDRMVKLGSYDKLKAAFSKNMGGGDVTRELDRQYKENANMLLDNWDDLHEHIEKVQKIAEDNGLTGMTKEQVAEWIKNLDVTDSAYSSYMELQSLIALSGYKYGDKTLLDFFMKTKAQVEKDGIETLYPMAACLSKGQICALNESVDIFKLIQEAQAASVVNDNNTGAFGEIKKVDGGEAAAAAQKSISEIDEFVAKAGENKVSIYEGVDRDVFKGGVAVTTDAKNASAGTEKKWTDIFVKEGDISNVSLISSCSAIATGLGAVVFAVAADMAKWENMNKSISAIFQAEDDLVVNGFSTETMTFFRANRDLTNARKVAEKALVEKDEMAKKAFKELQDHTKKCGNYKVYNGLKWGLTVFTVLLAVADIALTVYSLYQYYNVEHLPIPHHMVDRTYSETKEASYVAYKSVRDQDGNCGDLNGNSSKQWLALYYTKDKNAGTPILAPTEDGNEIVINIATTEIPGTGYTPLHMFGTTNVAQNLTFCDGESGYSYADKCGGIYLYYSHADVVVTYTGSNEESKSVKTVSEDTQIKEDAAPVTEAVSGSAADTGQTATAVSGGVLALIGVAGFTAGAFVGAVAVGRRRRKTAIKNATKN